MPQLCVVLLVCKYVTPKPISRQNQKTDTAAQLGKKFLQPTRSQCIRFSICNSVRLSVRAKRGIWSVCVFLSSDRRELPSDTVPTARRIHPPPMPATSYPRQTPHQPLPEEMLADGCPLGNVDGTATANVVGTIPWSPSDISPSASLCDT
jgi:hypothetical protein